MTLHYECSVPRRPNALFTIGDLLPAVGKKLKSALMVDVLQNPEEGEPVFTTVELAPYLDELTRIAQARNVFGCHFNQLSFELLEADALGFGEMVLQLMDILTDGNAGWPRNGKSGSYWATTGETRRLHPYKNRNNVMAAKKQKLELIWMGKEYRPNLEPRILIEETEKSYHAPHRVNDNDILIIN